MRKSKHPHPTFKQSNSIVKIKEAFRTGDFRRKLCEHNLSTKQLKVHGSHQDLNF